MVKSGLITVLIGQFKVNNIYKVGCLVDPNEKFFRLNVKMNVMVTMDKLNARDLQTKSEIIRIDAYQLISKLKNSFKAKFTTAGVEEILQ